MATPQITLRVDREKLAKWKAVAEKNGTNVSQLLRDLMDTHVGEQSE